MGKLFGTDGIRGMANLPPMTSETLVLIGRVAAHVVNAKKIVMGKDTRLSGYLIESALSSGIVSMGADVLLVGPMPTPGVAFLTSNMRAQSGIVISASHNPYQDNGVKFFGADGYKLNDEAEARIEDLVDGEEISSIRPRGMEVGRVIRISGAAGRYMVFLKSFFPAEFDLTGVKVVVDCANGAAYKIAPLVFEELGAKVVALNTKPNGVNINEKCGATHPDVVSKATVEHGADLGIALDGDGDRAIFCDEKGSVLDGDGFLAITARDWHQRGCLKQNKVVATQMSNFGLDVNLQSLGIEVLRTSVGDRYVVEEMRAQGCNLGGEQSGHIVMLDHNTTGDGIATALQLLAIMVRQQKPVSELRKDLEVFPQVLLNVRVREKRELSEMPEVTDAIRQAKDDLGKLGRVYVRYSGTEPLARVMVEGRDQTVIERHAKGIADGIEKLIGEQS